MFENKEVQELTQQVRELVAVNKSLLAKLEGQHKMLVVLADFVQKNSGTTPSFGTI
jgi:hypothetical protein